LSICDPRLDLHVDFAVANFGGEFAQLAARDAEQAGAGFDVEFIAVPRALQHLAVVGINELAGSAGEHRAADRAPAHRRALVRADVEHGVNGVPLAAEDAYLVPADLDDADNPHIEAAQRADVRLLAFHSRMLVF